MDTKLCDHCGHLPSEGKPYPWKVCPCSCHRLANRVLELFDLTCDLVHALDAIHRQRGTQAGRQLRFAHTYDKVCKIIAEMLFEELQVSSSTVIDKWGFLEDNAKN